MRYCAFILFLLVTSTRASTYYVAVDGAHTDGTTWATAYTNIQYALDVASDGDTINIGCGTFTSETNYIAQITNNNITIIGRGADKTILDGEWQRQCVKYTGSGIVIFGMTLLRGGGLVTSGISTFSATASASIYGCKFLYCAGNSIARIYAGDAYFYNCIFSAGQRVNEKLTAPVFSQLSTARLEFLNSITECNANSLIGKAQIGNSCGGQLYIANSIHGYVFTEPGGTTTYGGNNVSGTNDTYIEGARYVLPTVGTGTNAILGDYRLRYDATNSRNRGIVTAAMTNASSYAAYDINGLPRVWPFGSINVDIGPNNMSAVDHNTINRRRR